MHEDPIQREISPMDPVSRDPAPVPDPHPIPQRPVLRLTKRAEFVAAASGRRFHTERITVQGRQRDSAEASPAGLRIGFTVTKRVGHATERNRIRRRLRVAAASAGSAYADKAIDIVVIGRRTALSSDFATLVDDLDRALRVLTKPRSGRTDQARRGGPVRQESSDG